MSGFLQSLKGLISQANDQDTPSKKAINVKLFKVKRVDPSLFKKVPPINNIYNQTPLINLDWCSLSNYILKEEKNKFNRIFTGNLMQSKFQEPTPLLRNISSTRKQKSNKLLRSTSVSHNQRYMKKLIILDSDQQEQLMNRSCQCEECGLQNQKQKNLLILQNNYENDSKIGDGQLKIQKKIIFAHIYGSKSEKLEQSKLASNLNGEMVGNNAKGKQTLSFVSESQKKNDTGQKQQGQMKLFHRFLMEIIQRQIKKEQIYDFSSPIKKKQTPDLSAEKKNEGQFFHTEITSLTQKIGKQFQGSHKKSSNFLGPILSKKFQVEQKMIILRNRGSFEQQSSLNNGNKIMLSPLSKLFHNSNERNFNYSIIDQKFKKEKFEIKQQKQQRLNIKKNQILSIYQRGFDHAILNQNQHLTFQSLGKFKKEMLINGQNKSKSITLFNENNKKQQKTFQD